jgi:hypothetical protein
MRTLVFYLTTPNSKSLTADWTSIDSKKTYLASGCSLFSLTLASAAEPKEWLPWKEFHVLLHILTKFSQLLYILLLF